MSERLNAFLLRLLLLVAASSSAIASAQSYVAFEPAQSNSGRYPGAPVVPLLTTEEGVKISAPQVDEQVGFQSVQLSADRKRAGWIALTTDTFPSKLVIVRGNKIERVFNELCFDRWAFRHGGSQVIYAAEACHYFSGISITLVDVASGRQLAGFVVERDAETNEPLNLKQLPRWVDGFFPFDTEVSQ